MNKIYIKYKSEKKGKKKIINFQENISSTLKLFILKSFESKPNYYNSRLLWDEEMK